MTDLTFNQRMKKARSDAGLSLLDVVMEIRQRMPQPMWVGDSTVFRLETSRPETKADPFLVNVLASIYGVPTSQLSQVAADHLDTLRDLLEQASPCITA